MRVRAHCNPHTAAQLPCFPSTDCHLCKPAVVCWWCCNGICTCTVFAQHYMPMRPLLWPQAHSCTIKMLTGELKAAANKLAKEQAERAERERQKRAKEKALADRQRQRQAAREEEARQRRLQAAAAAAAVSVHVADTAGCPLCVCSCMRLNCTSVTQHSPHNLGVLFSPITHLLCSHNNRKKSGSLRSWKTTAACRCTCSCQQHQRTWPRRQHVASSVLQTSCCCRPLQEPAC